VDTRDSAACARVSARRERFEKFLDWRRPPFAPLEVATPRRDAVWFAPYDRIVASSRRRVVSSPRRRVAAIVRIFGAQSFWRGGLTNWTGYKQKLD